MLGLTLVATAAYGAVLPRSGTFQHPGLLHTDADFTRIKSKLATNSQPWVRGYETLVNNTNSQLGYVASPVENLCRGSNAGCTENYSNAFRDFAAAYQYVLAPSGNAPLLLSCQKSSLLT